MLIFLKKYICIKKVDEKIFRQRNSKSNCSQKLLLMLLHCSQYLPEIISFYIMVCSFKKKHVNVTTNLQSFLYIFLVLSVCVKHNRTFAYGNSLLRDKKLTHYHHHTMSTWGQNEKSIKAWIRCIRNISIKALGHNPSLKLQQSPTLEASNRLTKTIVPPKFSHSWIPSHWNFFITLICGIWVLYITTN